MPKNTITLLAVSAIAAMAWTSSASAAKHKHPTTIPAAHAAAQADQVQGANPMLNSPPTPAVTNPAPYKPVPGVNPM
ncbi:MAG TPA: hypothetical protein VKX28_17865 [Xanthobacteraceae bacterium]|jgi:hypothetical protein|nr:hypothetical protein [Xanthobacteraceae bacterium]